ncbi:type II secretion system protein GspM [Pararhodobacter sp. CCB-MM2]|uniref:type II secretion system protein GspM n=1 Tax=Pararhodobacter sp. CCB-MM2 TaxID=1786003 RepID=UPI00082B42D0|nr:type II secretion system protein GspM [Pararhodobacter sp. CCB-MM2]MCA2012764.1 type II secretion system protein M [Cereibacter sphaeroides]
MIAALARLLARRSPRERLLLALLVLAALPLGAVTLVALPLAEARQQAAATLSEARATQEWYRARQVEIAALPAQGGPAPEQARVAPVGLGGIEARLIEAGLRDGVTRLAEASGRRVALDLTGQPFAPLMDWLAALEADAGYRVSALQLERSGPGLVDAELQLEPLPETAP